ncbi:hypothetical protein O2313_11730 [Bacillus amyloliquefaciens]|uniref:hypothetical protein n=1 Tax=Bacillus amyloliquefaciens TaxID=1390 RepID=UPI0022AE671A|nr:hypothetical protein [Bacillus amyloliquefaciens]MCZ4248192.1 hypothetical protein [Bacillus amyloliquefaciens]
MTNGVIGGVNWVLKKVDMPTIDDVKMKHIPYFAKGTWQGDPNAFAGGLAHVGDGGKHELMRFPNGEMALSPNTDTIVNLPRGTSILGGDKTEQLMKSGALPKFQLEHGSVLQKTLLRAAGANLKTLDQISMIIYPIQRNY